MKFANNAMTTLIIYLIILGLAVVNQRKLMYLPGKIKLQDMLEKINNQNYQAWPSEQNYYGILKDSISQPTKGTVVVFHGNAGTAFDRRYYFDSLTNLGYRVILAEYPGYGGRSGKISEQSLIDDGYQIIKTVAQQFEQPIIVWGESLGSGVATGIINRDETLVHGAVLLTPFISMSKVAQHHYWFLFAGFFLWDRFDNVKNLKQFQGKTAILVSENDEIIPSKQGKQLYKQITSSKRMWLFEGANHNEWPTSPDNPWWKEVMDFMENK